MAYKVEQLESTDLFGERWREVSSWETMPDAYCDLMSRRDDGETVRIKEGDHE